jgi:hypothetical protein
MGRARKTACEVSYPRQESVAASLPEEAIYKPVEKAVKDKIERQTVEEEGCIKKGG